MDGRFTDEELAIAKSVDLVCSSRKPWVYSKEDWQIPHFKGDGFHPYL